MFIGVRTPTRVSARVYLCFAFMPKIPKENQKWGLEKPWEFNSNGQLKIFFQKSFEYLENS